ncbi:uncharacterized protein LOC113005129 [Solenopsis invicta]|uniref:uncharacterized protein LOC113005129 n=1 Tax=Solenopsis invicta TaxID=13686 RepID=UPI000E33D967|nr:uncharacterized protein LOC113005129 [Solenopsis invicta]
MKLAERLINNHLCWWLERTNVLPNSQAGFRSNRSCADNIAILHSDICRNWYNNKDTMVQFNDIDEIRHAKKGLPQGSLLSPILYSIYVAELEKLFHYNTNVKILQYADDVCLYVAHKNFIAALSELKEAGNRIAA